MKWLLSILMVLCLAVSVEAACVPQSSGELTAILSWTNTDPVTTDTINVLRSNSSGTEKVLINIPYGTTYTDTVPAPQTTTTYFYELQAKGPGGTSTASAEVCKTFVAVPPVPTNISIQ